MLREAGDSGRVVTQTTDDIGCLADVAAGVTEAPDPRGFQAMRRRWYRAVAEQLAMHGVHARTAQRGTFLVWPDGSLWLTYSGTFGDGPPWKVWLNYIDVFDDRKQKFRRVDLARHILPAVSEADLFGVIGNLVEIAIGSAIASLGVSRALRPTRPTYPPAQPWPRSTVFETR
jgi:hypothetical protein